MKKGQKKIPTEIKKEAEAALSFFPQLKDTIIEFKFNKIRVQSYMLAQPDPPTLLFRKSKRHYRILINKRYFVNNPMFENRRVPEDVLIGWLGHELGHIEDYKDRNSLNLVWFGFRYHFFHSFLKRAEITADYNAVKSGMAYYIIVSKEFGRNPKYFSKTYIDKLNKFYPPVSAVYNWAEALGMSTEKPDLKSRVA